MEVQEKNKCCDCVISQPKPDHYIEACKCEFDADFNGGKKDIIKRGIRGGERVEDMNDQVESFPPKGHPPPPNNYNNNHNNAAPGRAPQVNNPCRPQQAQLQQMQCGQAAQMQQVCNEDPYAALGDCVRECMLEKGEIARTFGIKCPDCDAPEEKSGKLMQADKIDKEDKADKGAKGAKGEKADKGAKGGKADKGKKRKPEK